MECINKKRTRYQGLGLLPTKKVKKCAIDRPNSKTIIANTQPEASVDETEGGGRPPVGVFEFPWREEGVVIPATPADVTADLRDVFFSSLVGGDSPITAVGFFADECEIDHGGSTPSDDETEGSDSIWSCVLRQPLAVCNASTPHATTTSTIA